MRIVLLLLLAVPGYAEYTPLPAELENASDKNFRDIDEEVERIDLTVGGTIEGSLTFNSLSTVTFSSSVVFQAGVTFASSTFISGDIQVSTLTFTTLNMICPTGFNAVQSTTSAHAPVLGCIEQVRQSSALYIDALMECFQNHGGTFPTVTMFQLAARLGIIDDATGASQWMDNVHTSDERILAGSGTIFNTTGDNEVGSHFYRCWVER